jgi:hypothetical protein
MKENNTFENIGNLQTSDLFSQKALPRKCLETFEESDGMVKKTFGTRPLFIGRRGVVSRNRLDMTVASFLGDACPLRRSRGDVFY